MLAYKWIKNPYAGLARSTTCCALEERSSLRKAVALRAGSICDGAGDEIVRLKARRRRHAGVAAQIELNHRIIAMKLTRPEEDCLRFLDAFSPARRIAKVIHQLAFSGSTFIR